MNQLAEEVLKILREEDQQAQKQGKKDAAFIKVKNDKKVMIIGDMHGSKEALLCIPVAEKILQEGGLVVILGDMIDRHSNFGEDISLGCLYVVLNLKKKYPANVIVLRGNHEAYFGSSNIGVSIDSNHCDEIVRTCIANFPLACIFENNGKNFFCVHGGICEEMYKNHSEADNFGLTKFKELSDYEIINLQALWNDFKGPGYNIRKNVAPLVVPFLITTGCDAILRGHDASHTAIDDQQNNISGKVYTILSNSVFPGEKVYKNDDRNARYAMIEGGNVSVIYFTKDLTEGNSMRGDVFMTKCESFLKQCYPTVS